jgi:hypothetical protein
MDLQNYDILEFIIDDSGSMTTTYFDKNLGRRLSRWDEAFDRMNSLIEIIAYVPIKRIRIKFLNRRARIDIIRDGISRSKFSKFFKGKKSIETPAMFIASMKRKLDKAHDQAPKGVTPVLNALEDSLEEVGEDTRKVNYHRSNACPGDLLLRRWCP